MHLRINSALTGRISGVTFGIATFSGVTVRPKDERLWDLIGMQVQERAGEFTTENLSTNESIIAVRGLQKMLGFDPSRYRPSSEALLRRVLKGQEQPQVNTAVDVNNLCSLEFLLPMCVYDLAYVQGQPGVRVGRSGEEYPGIGRQMFAVENRVVIADEKGVMGTTVSDSERTKVTTVTRDLFLLIYAPPQLSPENVHLFSALAARRMVKYNGGQVSDVGTITVE